MSADSSDAPKGRPYTLLTFVGPPGPPMRLSEDVLREYSVPTEAERGAAAERAAILAWLDRDIAWFKASDDPYLSEVDDIWNDARAKFRELIASGAHLQPRPTK